MSIHPSESHLFKAPATSHFVGGRWIASQEALDVQTPASNAVIRRIAHSSEPEVDAAVNAARSVLKGSWGQMSAAQRGRLLVQRSERILADLDRLAWVECLPPDGQSVAPAVFGPVPRDHELARDEVFGPVLAAIPFDDQADAVAMANSTDYALAAAVWMRDGDRQARMAKKVDAGQFFINCYGAGGSVEPPFGGNRKSGHGREKGWLALEEFSTTKTVVHYHG